MYQIVNENDIILGICFSLYFAEIFKNAVEEKYNTKATIKEIKIK